MTRARAVLLLILLFSLWARIYALDTAWIDTDRANVHGFGLITLDALLAGNLRAVPLLVDGSSSGLLNPPLGSYLYAFVALFGRGLVLATAVTLLLNVLATAAIFCAGRAVGGRRAGLFAAALHAGSNWAVFAARGTWHPGLLEAGTAVTFLVTLLALKRGSGRLLVTGFAMAALVSGAYFTAFPVLAQVSLIALAGGAWRARLRPALAAGLAICAAAVAIYALALADAGRLSLLFNLQNLAGDGSGLSDAELAARDITAFNRNPPAHFARLATNADFPDVWINPALAGQSALSSVTSAGSWLLTLAMLAGLLIAFRSRHKPGNRALWLWAALPVLVLVAIVLVKRDFRAPIYYLLLASPAQYILAALGLAWASTKVPPWLTGAAVAATSLVAAGNFVMAAQSARSQPYVGTPTFMPLRWAQRLGADWRANCSTLHATNMEWEHSLFEDTTRVRRGGIRFDAMSSAWSVPGTGGNCVLVSPGAPLPSADAIETVLDDGSRLRTFRARAVGIPQPADAATVNLGWTLLDFSARVTQDAPPALEVRHAWRVDALPNEPHATWLFAPYVKAFDADGRQIATREGAAALEGWEWRAGEVIYSTVRLPLQSIPVGNITVRATLFDPNQRKNAVYFAPSAPDRPILELQTVAVR